MPGPRLLATLIIAGAAACGGATPTSPSPVPSSFAMSAGAYTLSIHAAPRPPANSPGPSVMTCISIGPAPQAISLPVIAERDGAVWVIRPTGATLTLTLREVQGGVEGALAGTATHEGVTVRINQSTGASAAVSAPTIGVSTLSGFVEGDVHFSSPQGSGSCSSNGWSLARR